ncbi:MAG: hypothetical protein NZL91_01205 [Thermoflexales bacterium]|nr:hypothetical protein [Thermoflexales bacterium]MCX7938167.1 hypothetical protein [Thermoflexales bacterium]MDW8292558.1 hypothetical protein [Anaerolineae bacterium]
METKPHALREHHEDDEPHMPEPSLSPIILAAGMTALGFGIVLHPLLIVLGAIGTLVGLGTWLYDEIRRAPEGEDEATEEAPQA